MSLPAEPTQAVETAKALILQMSAQIALLVSMSLAICGGLLLLALQTLTHNHDNQKRPIVFRMQGLLFSALAFQGLSIFLGSLAYGAITDAVPAIFQWSYHATTGATNAAYEGSSTVRGAALLQWLAFLVSLFLAGYFIFRNRRILQKEEISTASAAVTPGLMPFLVGFLVAGLTIFTRRRSPQGEGK